MRSDISTVQRSSAKKEPIAAAFFVARLINIHGSILAQAIYHQISWQRSYSRSLKHGKRFRQHDRGFGKPIMMALTNGLTEMVWGCHLCLLIAFRLTTC